MGKRTLEAVLAHIKLNLKRDILSEHAIDPQRMNVGKYVELINIMARNMVDSETKLEEAVDLVIVICLMLQEFGFKGPQNTVK